MSNTTFISILTPIYNVAPYMERCARSLFEQTFPDLEFVFVDDCSPDESMKILQRVIADYPSVVGKVHIIRHERNRGLAVARNTAVAAANGEFIVHVDSDDWIESNAVELLVQKQIETGADIVSCDAIAHFSDRTEIYAEPSYDSLEAMIRGTMRLTIEHVIWRRLIRRSLYTDNHIACVAGVNIGEDHYTLPRLVFFAKSFATVDKPLWRYNCTNESSYTRASNGLNLRKYINDRDACLILSQFFAEHDKRYCEELEQIRKEYQYRSRNCALRCGDHEGYRTISKDLNLSSLDYCYMRPYTILCKIIRKLTGRRFGPLNY